MVKAFNGETVRLFFTLFQEDGSTRLAGALNADWTKTLLFNGAASAVALTVTETAEPGTYYAEFAPNADGAWHATAVHDDTEALYECTVDVGGDAEAFTNVDIESNTVRYDAWLSRNGRIVKVPSRARVELQDENGITVANSAVDSQSGPVAPTAQGHFHLTATGVVLTANRNYSVVVKVDDGRGLVESDWSLNTVSAA